MSRELGWHFDRSLTWDGYSLGDYTTSLLENRLWEYMAQWICANPVPLVFLYCIPVPCIRRIIRLSELENRMICPDAIGIAGCGDEGLQCIKFWKHSENAKWRETFLTFDCRSLILKSAIARYYSRTSGLRYTSLPSLSWRIISLAFGCSNGVSVHHDHLNSPRATLGGINSSSRSMLK